MNKREIKFRAWDKKNKYIVEPMNISWRCGDIKCIHHAKDHKGGVYLFNGENGSDFELMQYTGLHDKNGKEIYEGDIVETLEFHHSPSIKQKAKKHIISFDGGKFCLKNKLNEYTGDLEHYVINKIIQIIGNIFEDKKLFKSKTKI